MGKYQINKRLMISIIQWRNIGSPFLPMPSEYRDWYIDIEKCIRQFLNGWEGIFDVEKDEAKVNLSI
jgi:hypothetical protein